MSPAIILAILVILLSGGFTGWHIWSGKKLRGGALEKREQDYRLTQFRRRVRASTLLALVGVVMLGSELIANRIFQVILGMVMILLLLWIVFIAYLDMVATRRFYKALRLDHKTQQTELEAEIRQLQNRP